jgi:hypothetical protein
MIIGEITLTVNTAECVKSAFVPIVIMIVSYAKFTGLNPIAQTAKKSEVTKMTN